MDHTAGLRVFRRRGCLFGCRKGGALLLIQQRHHALRQVIHLGDLPGRQAGVLAGDQQADVLFLEHLQPAGRIPPTHIVEDEHGVQIAGHGQIQDLQRAVLGVLLLVFQFRQGHALPLHVRPVANEDAVVIAPGRKAQAPVHFQVLDRVEDIGAVLNDLPEQSPQRGAALVEHAGRVENGPVDAAALEDADVFQHGAVRRKEFVRVHLHGVHAAQLFHRCPARDDSTCRRSGPLQPQGGHTCHQCGGEGRAHAEYGGQGRRAAADAAAKQQEHQPGQHTGSQQDVRGLPGTALTGPLPKALLHQLFVPIGGAAEEDPGVFLVQTPGEHPDQVFVFHPVSTPVLRLAHGQIIAAFHGSQLHPAAQQGHKQAQCRDAGEDRKAGSLVALGVQQGDDRLQQGRTGGQRGHGVAAGASILFQA